MKILFIIAEVEFMDPLGLMLLSALAKREGHQTSLALLGREDVLERVEREKPDLIAYSATTGFHKIYAKTNEAIKARFPRVFTIMGGPHPTFYPQCVQSGALDAVCVGEGEVAFPELLSRLEKGLPLDGAPNILLKGGDPAAVQPAPPVEDLDSLPFPDRDLVYRATGMGDFPIKSFMASRGCPFNCSYCFNHAFARLYAGRGWLMRRRSVANVLEEIQRVRAEYPLEFVKFYDDNFVMRANEWLEEFAREYPRKVGLPFHCLLRPDLADEDVIRLLKTAGCVSISMSIESGSERIRRETLNRPVTDEQMRRAFKLCRQHGIKTFSNSILALPGASWEDDVATLRMNIECGVTFAEFPIYYPYPGTDLGEKCRAMGLWNGGYDDLSISYMGRSPLNCFTERQKDRQQNLSELGTVAVAAPWLEKIISKYLTRLPPNRVFFLAYYLVKAYLVTRRIYPVRLRPALILKSIRKSLRLESEKRT